MRTETFTYTRIHLTSTEFLEADKVELFDKYDQIVLTFDNETCITHHYWVQVLKVLLVKTTHKPFKKIVMSDSTRLGCWQTMTLRKVVEEMEDHIYHARNLASNMTDERILHGIDFMYLDSSEKCDLVMWRDAQQFSDGKPKHITIYPNVL